MPYKYIGKKALDYFCRGVPVRLLTGDIARAEHEAFLLEHFRSLFISCDEKGIPRSEPQKELSSPNVPESQESVTQDVVREQQVQEVQELQPEKIPSRLELMEWYKSDLVQYAEKLGIDSTGLKSDLIQRICEHLQIP